MNTLLPLTCHQFQATALQTAKAQSTTFQADVAAEQLRYIHALTVAHVLTAVQSALSDMYSLAIRYTFVFAMKSTLQGWPVTVHRAARHPSAVLYIAFNIFCMLGHKMCVKCVRVCVRACVRACVYAFSGIRTGECLDRNT